MLFHTDAHLKQVAYLSDVQTNGILSNIILWNKNTLLAALTCFTFLYVYDVYVVEGVAVRKIHPVFTQTSPALFFSSPYA